MSKTPDPSLGVHRVVMRLQRLLWIDETRIAELDECPRRVWTVLGEAKPELPMKPIHFENAFLEDRGHDWEYRNGKLKYFSRVSDGGVWLLLEYA
jgi:hypothetical protein